MLRSCVSRFTSSSSSTRLLSSTRSLFPSLSSSSSLFLSRSFSRSPSTMSSSTTPPSRPLLMIPGPTEYDPSVLSLLSAPSLSHVSPAFISEFSSALSLTRTLLSSTTAQPIILSGSGTVGWDIVAANLCEKGEKALIINTGYFSDGFSDCLNAYGIETISVKAKEIGGVVSVEDVKEVLMKEGIVYALVCITHVDTSTAVLNDIASLSSLISLYQPKALIAVDGVCSFGGEEFYMDQWKIDAAITCSQKALGTPPGLAIMALSQRAIQRFQSRTTPIPTYYLSLKNWLPIMRAYEEKKPSYFATPNVNLIRALNKSLEMIVKEQTIEKRIVEHRIESKAVKAAVKALGLKQVPVEEKAQANTLTAVYFPAGVEGPALLSSLVSNGIIAAGGLHKDIKTTYFRIGHMGVSVRTGSDHVLRLVIALETALKAGGYKFEEGVGVKAYQQVKGQA